MLPILSMGSGIPVSLLTTNNSRPCVNIALTDFADVKFSRFIESNRSRYVQYVFVVFIRFKSYCLFSIHGVYIIILIFALPIVASRWCPDSVGLAPAMVRCRS